jgi:hypothetical protein
MADLRLWMEKTELFNSSDGNYGEKRAIRELGVGPSRVRVEAECEIDDSSDADAVSGAGDDTSNSEIELDGGEAENE